MLSNDRGAFHLVPYKHGRRNSHGRSGAAVAVAGQLLVRLLHRLSVLPDDESCAVVHGL